MVRLNNTACDYIIRQGFKVQELNFQGMTKPKLWPLLAGFGMGRWGGGGSRNETARGKLSSFISRLEALN